MCLQSLMQICKDLAEETFSMESFLSILVLVFLISIEKKLGLQNEVLYAQDHCTKRGLKDSRCAMKAPSTLLELKIIKILRIMHFVHLIHMTFYPQD